MLRGIWGRMGLTGAAAALSTAIVIAVGGGEPAGAAATTCTNADALPGSVSNKALANSALCLLNKERTKRGIAALRRSTALTLAAQRYATYLATHNCFSHFCGPRTFQQRLRSAGYRGTTVGEDLGMGIAQLGTPRAIMRIEITNRAHRVIALSRRFNQTGLGAAVRGSTAYYVFEFGHS